MPDTHAASSAHKKLNPVRLYVRTALITIIAVIFTPALFVSSYIFPPVFIQLRIAFYKTLLFVSGIKIEVEGKVSKKRGTMFAPNHISYLDIIALGSKVPGTFIAKSDVKGWPGLGIIAIITKTIFIARETMFPFAELCKVKRKLYGGENLILFPEGTTSNGNELLKFKSSLFRIAEEANEKNIFTLQPVTIAYTKLGKEKTTSDTRPILAWFGDMTLLPHLGNVLSMRDGITITLKFHNAFEYSVPTSRKLVTHDCKKTIESSFYEMIS